VDRRLFLDGVRNWIVHNQGRTKSKNHVMASMSTLNTDFSLGRGGHHLAFEKKKHVFSSREVWVSVRKDSTCICSFAPKLLHLKCRDVAVGEAYDPSFCRLFKVANLQQVQT